MSRTGLGALFSVAVLIFVLAVVAQQANGCVLMSCRTAGEKVCFVIHLYK